MPDIQPDFSAPFFGPLYSLIGIVLALLVVASFGFFVWGAITWVIGREGNHQAASDGMRRMGIAVLGLILGLSAGSLMNWAQVFSF